jgi:hypothetical protein
MRTDRDGPGREPGGGAYVSLKVPRGAGLKAMRAAVTGLLSRPGSSRDRS